jgi:DNA (cytosine-5)-methyltransferase 1
MSFDFTFIDLFAGIGGIRIAFEAQGGKCVFSSEYDQFAQKTYRAFFGETPDFANVYKADPPGDITQIPASAIPDHDILTGGFPCQPFSLAGVSKKQSLGRPHGFADPTQGTLFFDIKRILKEKRPKAFLLENVKNLVGHDKGRTFGVIRSAMEELEYSFDFRVIDAAGWLPQHRERTYMVGFDLQRYGRERVSGFSSRLSRVRPHGIHKSVGDLLCTEVDPKYTLGDATWATLERHKEHHKSKGNGFGYGLIARHNSDRPTRTLSARYHKDGAEVLIDQWPGNPRRLTPLECLRLMGFPKKYEKWFDGSRDQPVSDTQAYRQFGNSVAVPVVKGVARQIVVHLGEINDSRRLTLAAGASKS